MRRTQALRHIPQTANLFWSRWPHIKRVSAFVERRTTPPLATATLLSAIDHGCTGTSVKSDNEEVGALSPRPFLMRSGRTNSPFVPHSNGLLGVAQALFVLWMFAPRSSSVRCSLQVGATTPMTAIYAVLRVNDRPNCANGRLFTEHNERRGCYFRSGSNVARRFRIVKATGLYDAAHLLSHLL